MSQPFVARVVGVNVYAVTTWDDPELRAVVRLRVGDPDGPCCDFDSIVYDEKQFATLLLALAPSGEAGTNRLLGRLVLCQEVADDRVRLLGFFNPITED